VTAPPRRCALPAPAAAPVRDCCGLPSGAAARPQPRHRPDAMAAGPLLPIPERTFERGHSQSPRQRPAPPHEAHRCCVRPPLPQPASGCGTAMPRRAAPARRAGGSRPPPTPPGAIRSSASQTISPPGRRLAEPSPMTQRRAWTRFDFPQPFGPTMPVRPGSIASSVASTKDLNPTSRNRSHGSRLSPGRRRDHSDTESPPFNRPP
jgi:hypothetical protein